ncbi:MAG: deoxyhypusine synthase [Candidatus Caldarchaeum sp.]|uniref:Deoxyhypusine synthase n=1 Tax=Caldiarchaeum subterraneum TaxID=311458 RepID=A0A7C5L8D1_CALS0
MFVEDISLDKGVSAVQLLKAMGRMGGFMGFHLAQALEILKEAVTDKSCLKAISFTGNLVATGLRGVFVELLRRRMFDVVFTTCGALDHDIARTRSAYRVGSFDADDWELAEKNIHRLGSVFIDQESYGLVIEREAARLLEKIGKNAEVSVHRLCWMLGEQLASENSFLYWCWRNNIPVFVPGFADGALGYQVWLQGRSKGVKVGMTADMDLINEIMWKARKKAGLVIGGGISKHHLLWWSQFGGEGLDMAVYISSADEYDGSLSGARPREAVTWHKVSPKSKHVFVKADATVVLPFLALALIQSVEG